VPAICEYFGVPYTGSDPLTLSLCLDKSRTKEILSHYGVATPSFVVVESADAVSAHWPALRYPLFVKPIHEGSSKGITERNLCQTPADLATQVEFLLETYAQPVLIEEFLPGAEFTCAVLGNGRAARVLPIVGREEVFALKGGTAINLFVRDLPRLSVDIDLTFLPLVERNEALVGIRDAELGIANTIPRAGLCRVASWQARMAAFLRATDRIDESADSA